MEGMEREMRQQQGQGGGESDRKSKPRRLNTFFSEKENMVILMERKKIMERKSKILRTNREIQMILVKILDKHLDVRRNALTAPR